MKLSLAPLSYYWSKEDTMRFYVEAMHWPVDTIYLGETVCSRRHEMRLADWVSLAKACRDAGKEVILSTLTLIDSDSDRRAMHKLVDAAAAENIMVEANDFSAVRACRGHDFVAGSHLNVYHDGTLNWLYDLGARRFIPPIELSADDLSALQAHRPAGLETEVQVWGRMHLAFSSRCFTARHHRLRKDNCEFSCEHYPDGLAMRTREQADFLTVNGIQTQSAHCLDLGPQVPALQQLGVDYLRLQVQSKGMEQIVHAFDTAIRRQQAAQLDAHLLPPNAQACNGYWSGKSGMQWHSIPIHAIS
ncbi:ubiquinone anaerobic biosynthesis protein UbiV [Undibacterium fentianense]|uniref:Ubiquinone biosynthesis protein UbiV n=1 Tax=Undibacterium fentianense TaxID=2828728 RepID=A0A941ICF5_9BURK|nr:U32 family peptidase [Undibacterium fentianense]MBR7800134.1 U32 family peptidase [Undibacterium fentianense]